MQTQPFEVGDEVGHRALEDALTLAQDIQLGGRSNKRPQLRNGGLCRPAPQGRSAETPKAKAAPRGFGTALTLSNISKSFALGWWMVQVMVRPPWARDFSRETTWKQEALSRPLQRQETESAAVRRGRRAQLLPAVLPRQALGRLLAL